MIERSISHGASLPKRQGTRRGRCDIAACFRAQRPPAPRRPIRRASSIVAREPAADRTRRRMRALFRRRLGRVLDFFADDELFLAASRPAAAQSRRRTCKKTARKPASAADMMPRRCYGQALGAQADLLKNKLRNTTLRGSPHFATSQPRLSGGATVFTAHAAISPRQYAPTASAHDGARRHICATCATRPAADAADGRHILRHVDAQSCSRACRRDDKMMP